MVAQKTNKQQGLGVRCPECDAPTRVLNSVPIPEKRRQGRYRECDLCQLRIYTEEYIVRVTTPKNG